jgi:cardiolipin synthase
LRSNPIIKKQRNIDGIVRIVLVGLAVLAQLFLLILLVTLLRQNSVYIYFLLEVLGLIGALVLANKNDNSTYTISWLIIILVLPVFGFLLYLLWGRTSLHGRKSKMIRAVLAQKNRWLKKDPEVQAQLQQTYPSVHTMACYLEQDGFPLYKNTTSRYFELGELQFDEMLNDMKKAQKFIFLEYFILAQGQLWDRFHKVLKRKASQGVDVRLLFDDMGSIIVLPDNLLRELKNEKIMAHRFNPVHKHISRFYVNYRNHQKIAVIDGNIGYIGGTNLADEYANLYTKHGHWKDTAIRMEGDAVWSLTITFLQMWMSETGIQEDCFLYRPTVEMKGDGFYLPFSDGPVNNPDNPAEMMYLKMIFNAKDYVYITTPYLVIDNPMLDALCAAARGGVEVRIITPKIWDHWYVHMVTRSNYGRLIEAGVRIYEYTPGYIHAKTIISDDEHAITGSINMDYRSFYLHFENGVWMCGTPVLKDIIRDLNETFKVCEKISLEEWKNRPLHIKILQAFLRLFIPLL